MELLRSHVPFIREMISNVKTADYRKKWEKMLAMIESDENLSATQIETMNQNVAKAKQFKQQYESKSPQPSTEQRDDSQDEGAVATAAIATKAPRFPEKRRLNELRRLHENIVKNEVITTKRVSKRASFNDYLEEKDLVVRRRKSDFVLVRRNDSTEGGISKKAKTSPEEDVAKKAAPAAAPKRASLPAKPTTEEETKVKKVRLHGKLVSVVMETPKNGQEIKGRRIHLDGRPARVVANDPKEEVRPPAKRGRKRTVIVKESQPIVSEQKLPMVTIPQENVVVKKEVVEKATVVKNTAPTIAKKVPQVSLLKPKVELAPASVSEKVIKNFPENAAPLKVRVADLKSAPPPQQAKSKEKSVKDSKISSLQMFCKKIQKQHEKKTKKSFRNALLKKRIHELKQINDIDDGDDDEWEDLEEEKITESSREEVVNQLNFKKVENIAYAASNDTFIFRCLAKHCTFGTDKNELFLDHLEDNHMDVKWSGFCGICDKMASTKQRLVIFELMHMREDHVLKEQQDTLKKEMITPKVEENPTDEMKKKSKNPSPAALKKPMPSHEKVVHIPSENQITGIKKHIIMKPTPPAAKVTSPAPNQASPPTPPSPPPPPPRESSTEKQTLGAVELLRPWCKRKVKKFVMPATQMLNSNVLIAKYKCMGKLCSYFTSDASLFNTHLKFHEKFAPADKDYLNCAYCDRDFNYNNNSVSDLITHINIYHGYDKYACSYCFYRSCANFNVLSHQKIYHNTKTKMIYELNMNKVRDYAKEFEGIKLMRSKVVPPIQCPHCTENFFVFQELRAHLKSHDSKTLAKCVKCKQTCSNEGMPTHWTHCMKIGIYQCLYCRFGTSAFQAICDHVADLHSSKIPVFCERARREGENGGPATIESLCIKHITQIVDARIVQKCTLDDKDLRNEEQVMHLGGSVKIQKISDTFKKVKMTAVKEVPKKKENVEEKSASTLQIKNVFSLSDLQAV